MKVAWDPRLAVGVHLIDSQHRELFRQVNGLLQAMEQNRGREEVGRILGFLERYAASHFAAEERLMARHAYPQGAAHGQRHVDFAKVLAGLKGELERSGPTAEMAVKLNHTVCGWLREHIGVTDRQLGQFLASRGLSGATA